ncbi:hypothetical protein LPB136_11040 [Tenacibaculum todarodis]|uniref:Uncharacterized protein n=1 Tax=Tenacibaculum todarodis TaxID=1850252 RepID=A0A1L3JL70_9FLAO|nr:hypothetical protein [Tenacibaculum todarodis]APG65867.1 hypothetical protein LPB136_11040 [Tenacibaculum todarodis]
MSAQQKLKGNYSSVDGIGVFFKNYSFDEDSVFIYEEGGDLGVIKYGKGHYIIKNDSLLLNYDLTQLKEESYFTAKKYYNSKDSIKVRLNIYNFDRKPLYNIQIYSQSNLKSTESDKNGNAILIFKKGEFKEIIEIHIDGDFFAKQIIYLHRNSNYIVDVFMSKSKIIGFGHPRAIKNEIIKYKIIENNKKCLKLKKENKIVTYKKL